MRPEPCEARARRARARRARAKNCTRKAGNHEPTASQMVFCGNAFFHRTTNAAGKIGAGQLASCPVSIFPAAFVVRWKNAFPHFPSAALMLPEDDQCRFTQRAQVSWRTLSRSLIAIFIDVPTNPDLPLPSVSCPCSGATAHVPSPFPLNCSKREAHELPELRTPDRYDRYPPIRRPPNIQL